MDVTADEYRTLHNGTPARCVSARGEAVDVMSAERELVFGMVVLNTRNGRMPTRRDQMVSIEKSPGAS